MKKRLFVLILALAFIVCLSACGKKAEPISLPSADEITSIKVADGAEDIIITDKEAIEAIISKAREAKSTSQESVQDVPTADDYTKIDFVCDGNIASIFVYQLANKWYIEQPYQGIYETAENIVAGFTKDNLQSQDPELMDRRPTVMIAGKIYYDTGKESTITGRCGVMDGKITSSVGRTQVPAENNQSNFGSGYEYQNVAENVIEILMNEKWCVFESPSGNESQIKFGEIWYNTAD